ncbi:hypothetical protein LY01_00133 [Nonlabens xylanidelens]|uniref:Uncharacterized protein n=1 Tax=Nonlabens xylanidelens TaxID=191564 RepID=A0A2S6IQ74_9FLAO|nr:hypothetical protein [Nonlabens xylanidelens]PPK96315.1 hypothetical protein LY01_00133 [Nonlabens xylanidelens]PQJ18044.1 hypothetical protein BST94_08520 [Nonlabens xylanidelens]
MKKIINYTAILLGIIAFNSCSSDKVSGSIDIESYIFKSALSSAENQVFVEVTGANNVEGTHNTVQVDFVGDDIQPFAIDGSNFITDLFSENILYIGAGENMNMTNVTSIGNVKEVIYQGISEEVYVPRLVEVPENLFTNGLFVDISKENGITIPWTQDSYNPFGKIFLVVINRGERFSNIEDNPFGVISEVITDDEESFTISPDALADFEIGDGLDIYIARGNEVQINDTAFVFYNINSFFGRIIN